MTDRITDELTSVIDRYLDSYGEPDAIRRDELIASVWETAGELIDPPIEGTGHAGISETAAAVQSQFAGHTFRRTSGIDAHMPSPATSGSSPDLTAPSPSPASTSPRSPRTASSGGWSAFSAPCQPTTPDSRAGGARRSGDRYRVEAPRP